MASDGACSPSGIEEFPVQIWHHGNRPRSAPPGHDIRPADRVLVAYAILIDTRFEIADCHAGRSYDGRKQRCQRWRSGYAVDVILQSDIPILDPILFV